MTRRSPYIFQTAERLTNLLAALCVVAWRVFWLTMTAH
jgi:hypothetical protein